MSSTRRDDVQASILRWAGAREDVAAVIQTGSLARSDGSADPIIVLHLEQDDGWPTRLAIYDDGIDGSVKVDFTLAAPRRLRKMISSRTLSALYARGYRVLLDKDGVTKDLPPPSGDVPRRSLPAVEAFRLYPLGRGGSDWS